jgi:hypothetical protein
MVKGFLECFGRSAKAGSDAQSSNLDAALSQHSRRKRIHRDDLSNEKIRLFCHLTSAI